jgi:hypothetical protein
VRWRKFVERQEDYVEKWYTRVPLLFNKSHVKKFKVFIWLTLVHWYKLTNVSEVLTASIIRAMSKVLLINGEYRPLKQLIYTSLHGATTQNTAIFILTAMTTSNPT